MSDLKMNMSLDDIIKTKQNEFPKNNKSFQKREQFNKNNQIQGKFNKYNEAGKYINKFQNNPNFKRGEYSSRGSRGGFSSYGNRIQNNFRRRVNLNEDLNHNKNKDASEENKTRLFIRNLNRSIINTELRAIFEKCGPLKRCGIHWDDLGNSLGTADVEYYTPENAKKAINDYHKAIINDVEVLIEYANCSKSVGKKIDEKIDQEDSTFTNLNKYDQIEEKGTENNNFPFENKDPKEDKNN